MRRSVFHVLAAALVVAGIARAVTPGSDVPTNATRTSASGTASSVSGAGASGPRLLLVRRALLSAAAERSRDLFVALPEDKPPPAITAAPTMPRMAEPPAPPASVPLRVLGRYAVDGQLGAFAELGEQSLLLKLGDKVGPTHEVVLVDEEKLVLQHVGTGERITFSFDGRTP